MNHALVVGDLRAARGMIGKELVEATFEVSFAETEEASLRLLPSERFDLVVTDHHAQRLDGVDLVRRIRAFSEVPVVVLTAFGSVPECERAMRFGADRFLQYRRDLSRLGQVARGLVEAPRTTRRACRARTNPEVLPEAPVLTAESARALRERELRERLQRLVIECRGNVAEVARQMNRDRSTIRYHLRRLGLMG